MPVGRFGLFFASVFMALGPMTASPATAQPALEEGKSPAERSDQAPGAGQAEQQAAMVRYLTKTIQPTVNTSQLEAARPEIEARVRDFLIATGQPAGTDDVVNLTEAVLDEFGVRTPASPILVEMRESPLREALTATWANGGGRMMLSDLQEKSEILCLRLLRLQDTSMKSLGAADRAFADRLAAEVARANPVSPPGSSEAGSKGRGDPLSGDSLPQAIEAKEDSPSAAQGSMVLGEVRDKLEAFLRQAHDALLQFDPPLSGPQRKAELMRYVKEDKGFLAVFTQAAGRENPTEADYAEIEKIVDSLVRSSPTPATQAPSPAPQQTGFGAQVLQALPGVAETVLSTAVAGDPWIGEAVILGEAVAPLVIEGFRRCRLFNGGRGRGRAYVMEY